MNYQLEHVAIYTKDIAESMRIATTRASSPPFSSKIQTAWNWKFVHRASASLRLATARDCDGSRTKGSQASAGRIFSSTTGARLPKSTPVRCLRIIQSKVAHSR